MASKIKVQPKSGQLNNKNTRFGSFSWGEHQKLREAIQKVRDQMNGTLPTRFKIKL